MPLSNFSHTLIPFGLPPAEHASDLVKMLTAECGLDGLATLLSRYQSRTRRDFEDFSPALPHEVWLNEQSSLLQQMADSLNVTLNPGHWFLLTPVHLHIARNHLVLTDYLQLNLSEHDALTLFEKARILSNEAGVELVYGNATTWFLRADEWSDFVTSTPDAACGHNIEIWSAKGTKELAWRKLQNEIQMEWFACSVQQQREQRGEKAVNGLWLWAGSSLLVGCTPSPPPLSHKWEREVEQLRTASLANDWGTWAKTMVDLDQHYFKPLVAALKTREITQLQLHLSNSKTLLSIQTSSSALKKFWRRPTFKHLMT